MRTFPSPKNSIKQGPGVFVFELGHLSHDVWHMISIQTKSESGAGSNCHIRALLMMILDLGEVGESENLGERGVKANRYRNKIVDP